jgi:molecular chaperone HtpG
MTEVKENPEMETGSISVHTDNIFPIIKKSLYSDHEIFLRELVSNAVDASQKLKFLATSGKYTDEVGDLKIKVELNAEAKTITISDSGIGLSADEVRKYINQVAFSGAEEFVKKFKSAGDRHDIIGQFGLGFYSAFMVADSVEIESRSYKKNTGAVHWTCDGSTKYTLDKSERKERGTTITLHIAEDSAEFLEKGRIEGILKKYCRFLPIEIEFDGVVINNPNPIWKKSPTELTDEDYIAFHKELYPYSEEPLFWIHLNVDYPFNLTGILYFPRLKNEIEVRKDRIHLYSRQVFITDQVENIVPEFLMLLQGVIDSPDIPLNVSRSYLQSDANVKKISTYITKKVGDKLSELYKESPDTFKSKWPQMEVFVKYGMLSDEKFYDKAADFCLVKNLEESFYTLEEYRELIKDKQTDKDGNLVVLYTNDALHQDAFINSVKRRNWDVLLQNGPLDSHWIGLMERKMEKTQWKRVDADAPEKLIAREEKQASVLTEDQEKAIVEVFKSVTPDPTMTVTSEALGPDEQPVVITRPEFFRRMKDMAASSSQAGNPSMPDYLNLVINSSHPLNLQVLNEKSEEGKKALAQQVYDIALLSQSLLRGAALTAFVQRTLDGLVK